MFRNLNQSIKFCIGLTFIVILFGAYTRLRDAGLGCPDWPGCYGHLLAPRTGSNFSLDAVTKAWIEMIHRYIAGILGLTIFIVAIITIKIRSQKPYLWLYASGLVCLVIFQALLGMWTVTLKLNPLVVMGHLLGGLAIISLLWWIYLDCTDISAVRSSKSIQILSLICLLTTITQIALGGWTSANYAALVCADFPTCQGSLWPMMDWRNAFAVPNIPLENAARVTIQMAHRIGALVTTILCSMLCVKLLHREKILKVLGIILAILVTVQIILGITNVLYGLPLLSSLAHSAIAVIILLSLLSIIYIVNAKRQNS